MDVDSGNVVRDVNRQVKGDGEILYDNEGVPVTVVEEVLSDDPYDQKLFSTESLNTATTTEAEPAKEEKCVFFIIFIYRRFRYDFAYSRVKRWTKSVDIFEKKYLFIPINEQYVLNSFQII
jgi:hypothetical protein